MAFHSIPFQSIPFRSGFHVAFHAGFHSMHSMAIPFHSIPFHSIPFHSIHSIPFHSFINLFVSLSPHSAARASTERDESHDTALVQLSLSKSVCLLQYVSRSPAFCRRLRYGYDGATYFLILFCAYLYILSSSSLLTSGFFPTSHSYLGVALSVCLVTSEMCDSRSVS